MNPVKHVLSTVLVFLAARFFVFLDAGILFWSVFLTLFIDVVDHGLLALTSRNQELVRLRRLFFKGKVVEAYRDYYEKRRRLNSFAFLHNMPAVAVAACLTVAYKSPVLALGVLLHYALDLTDHYQHEKNLNFWFFRGMRKTRDFTAT